MAPLAIRKERLDLVKLANFLSGSRQVRRQAALVEIVNGRGAHAQVQIVEHVQHGLAHSLAVHSRAIKHESRVVGGHHLHSGARRHPVQHTQARQISTEDFDSPLALLALKSNGRRD
jgi:hypothetical protein